MNGINRKIGAGAVALGVALGSYGIASAASRVRDDHDHEPVGDDQRAEHRAEHRSRRPARVGRPTERRDAPHRRHGRQGEGDRARPRSRAQPSFASRRTPTATPHTRRT